MTLPKTTLTVNATTVKTYVTSTDGEHGQVVVQNTGSAIAFMVRLELLDSSGNEILPVFWQDNYVSLLPGERREIGVSTQVGARSGSAVVAEAWNVPSMRVPVR